MPGPARALRVDQGYFIGGQLEVEYVDVLLEVRALVRRDNVRRLRLALQQPAVRSLEPALVVRRADALVGLAAQ